MIPTASRERLLGVRAELRSRFIERDEVVDGALLALLSRQHVLLLGPPGSAKSMLARELCRRLDGKRYFEWLLTKFTTPEEVFGPVSLPALEEGRYERVTSGKLAEAEIVFLDEIMKANSAILNALLAVMNERRFHQGTRVIDIPLETMIAAANELPDEDELAALYDRFLLRFTVGYVGGDAEFARLLALADDDTIGARLAPDDVTALQQAVHQIALPDAVVRELVELRRALAAEQVVASDRRYRQSLAILRASALLDGREEVTIDDLRWLEHVLWSDPEERPKVQAALAKLATGFEEELKKLLGQAREIESYARRSWPDMTSKSRALLEAHTKLGELSRRARSIQDAAAERGRAGSRLREMVEQLTAIAEGLHEGRN